MAFRDFLPHVGALALIPALAGCATAPWDDPVDVTELLRMAPEDLVLEAVIPRGLGETGTAAFQWSLIEPEHEAETSERFTLIRTATSDPDATGATHVTYELPPQDRARFQTQQIRQRAQLLSGYYNARFAARPEVCDQIGVAAGSDVVYGILQNRGSGAKITTLRLAPFASALKREAPPCE